MRVFSLFVSSILATLLTINVTNADHHIEAEDVTIETETITVPLMQKNFTNDIEMPKRGLSKSAVLRQYGEPASKVAPRGKPPISRWVYPQFTVYFESDYVIHSVLKPH